MSISMLHIRLEIQDSAELIELNDYHHSMPRSKAAQIDQRGDGSSSNANKHTVSKLTKSFSLENAAKMHGDRKFQEIIVEKYDCMPSTSSSSVPGLDVAESDLPGRTDFPDRLHFFTGNPEVEKTQGILHLYKQNEKASLTDQSGRSDVICMLAVPATLNSHDLLQFLAPHKTSISQMKVIRDASPNQYMVLIYFRDPHSTDVFYQEYNGIRFNNLEANVCYLVYVSQVETKKESDCAAWPIAGLTELPNCPVCLERMDESVDGLLTILCNHSFHADCLFQWGDTSCPVCRYSQTPDVESDQKCEVCQKKDDLWICLICGYIGCGRYAGGHSHIHFQETQHTYSLMVGGQRVWDYAGDNYVHRLIQNKTDGKLVEFEDPLRNPSELDQDEKLDAVTLEYTYLLTSQLESQRHFFEEKCAAVEKMAYVQIDDLSNEIKTTSSKYSTMEDELRKLSVEKQVAEKKLQLATNKLSKLTFELDEEKQMAKCLLSDQSKWAEKVSLLEKKLNEESTARKKETADLEEQLRDLMFHFEAQDKIKNATENEVVSNDEVLESSMSVGPLPTTRRNKRRGNK